MTELAEQEKEVTVIVDDEPEAAGEPISAEAEVNEDDDDDEVLVSIGEAPAPEPEEERAPEWVRDLRRKSREDAKRIRELEAKLNAPAETKPAELGPKPTLESCEYDEDAFEAKLTDWHSQKREAEAKAKEAEAEAQRAADEWQAKLNDYADKKAKLRVPDYEDVEAFALDTFGVTQQGVILQGSDNPALLIYAIGKDQAKAKELAAIKDPVKFAFAVAKLETQLKVTKRKAGTAPEKAVTTGGVPNAGSIDSKLEALREKAARTGDYSEVHAYKRKLKS